MSRKPFLYIALMILISILVKTIGLALLSGNILAYIYVAGLILAIYLLNTSLVLHYCNEDL